MHIIPHNWHISTPESYSADQAQPQTQTPHKRWLPLKHLPVYEVALCTVCRVAIPQTEIDGHLRTTHKDVRGSERAALVKAFLDLPIARTVTDLHPRADGSPPLPFLNPPRPGFCCPKCRSFKTVSWQMMKKHDNTVHGARPADVRRESAACFLQRWTMRTGRVTTSYWTVDTTCLPSDSNNVDRDGSSTLYSDNGEEKTLAEADALDQSRIDHLSEPSLAFDEAFEADENTHWLRGCGWPRWFHQKPLQLIVAAAAAPAKGHSADLYLGRWNGIECVSPAAFEKILQLLQVASKHVFERCHETLGQTPRILRCWLRSWGHSYSPYPFELPTTPTVHRYTQIWIRAVCYFFRMRHLGQRLNESTQQLCGLQLTDVQIAAMDDVHRALFELLSLSEMCDPLEAIPRRCSELVFQLFVTFWTDVPPNGDLEGTAVAHFSGVLGIHPTEFAYRRAYDYTPFLSALIWVGRLVILEYALPLRPYHELSLPWPGREVYSDIRSRLCEQIRPKYAQRGSLAPIGYLIERLQHGRAIAKREGPGTTITWSLDGQTLGIADQSITMCEFRRVIYHAITRTQQQLDDLMFGWWPETNLRGIRDNLANRRPGYSFILDPANHLQSSFRALSRRAFSEIGQLSLRGAGRVRAQQYLRGQDRLVRHLFAIIHLTSGMPARAEELRMIRWANTPAALRNIFIYNGKIILVFSYNKAGTNHNNSFYIVRRPCPAVEKMLFLYLVHVRPFCDFLAGELRGRPCIEPNRHLFAQRESESACFKPSDCLKSFQEATSDSPITWNLRCYRHIAIAISKRHIPLLVQPFNPHVPQDYDGFLSLLAFQTGHKPSTHAGAYALEVAFPARLQPGLIDRYLQNSDVWHRFTLTRESDYIEGSVDASLNAQGQHRPLSYFPDPPCDRDDATFNCNIQTMTEKKDAEEDNDRGSIVFSRRACGWKREHTSDALSPTSKKIKRLHIQILELQKARNHRSECKSISYQYGES